MTNQLLKELDRFPKDSIIIAATNFRTMIDDAVLRRFNFQWYLEPPSDEAIDGYIRDYQRNNGLKFTKKELARVPNEAYGKAWSYVEDFCTGLHLKRVVGHELHFVIGWAGETKKKERAKVGFGFFENGEL